MSFRLFGLEWISRWKTLSIYEKFEQLIVSILTWIIAVIVAVATWQLILHTVSMIRSHLLDPRDSQAFHKLRGHKARTPLSQRLVAVQALQFVNHAGSFVDGTGTLGKQNHAKVQR
jgi:hypothetical protein